MLNRSLIVVRAKPPFLDWLRSLPDPVDDSITLERINEDAAAYLAPEYEDDHELSELLGEVYDILFTAELSAWWQDEADWPMNRNFEMFRAWFDVECHSLVHDLVDGPLYDDDEGQEHDHDDEDDDHYHG